MHRGFMILVLTGIVQIAYAQHYVNGSRQTCKKAFERYGTKNKFQTNILESDSTITMLVRDTAVQNLDIILRFGLDGKCDRQVTTLSCDSCYNKYVNSILSNKYYRWTKVAGNTYFSRALLRFILTAPLADPFSFSIQRSSLSKHAFKEMAKTTGK